VDPLGLLGTGGLDAAAELAYYRARYYHAGLGQFVNRDPLVVNADLYRYASTNGRQRRGAQRLELLMQDRLLESLNLRRYARNNPLVYTDPNGQFPVVAVGAGVVAAGILVAVMPDWGTDWLSDAQAQQVNSMTQKLLKCANSTGDTAIVSNLESMTITAIFEPGKMEDDSTSETRNGRFFGWSNRTILSADFFQRDCASQMRPLLHESYHAGTEDWTESKSYDYADKSFDKLKKCCPDLCK
jgi:RHS repeat-associated protein